MLNALLKRKSDVGSVEVVVNQRQEELSPITDDRAVVRPQVFMLNGTGPVNPPQTILFYDGSDAAEQMYQILEEAEVDFSVSVITGQKQQPFVHSRRLMMDLTDQKIIRRFASIERETDRAMAPLVGSSMPSSMREHASANRQGVKQSLARERQERERLRAETREMWISSH